MIKRLTSSDLSLVENLLHSQNKSDPKLENIAAFLENEFNYFMAYVEEGEIIGFALAYTLQRYDGQNSMMYLHEIGVNEDSRRKGIGKKLLKALKNICTENDFMKLFLITNKSNRPAVRLYESLDGETDSDDDVVYTIKM